MFCYGCPSFQFQLSQCVSALSLLESQPHIQNLQFLQSTALTMVGLPCISAVPDLMPCMTRRVYVSCCKHSCSSCSWQHLFHLQWDLGWSEANLVISISNQVHDNFTASLVSFEDKFLHSACSSRGQWGLTLKFIYYLFYSVVSFTDPLIFWNTLKI